MTMLFQNRIKGLQIDEMVTTLHGKKKGTFKSPENPDLNSEPGVRSKKKKFYFQIMLSQVK